MLAAINIIFLILIVVWVWRCDTGPLHKFYWPAVIVKCLAGISLGIIYSTYYDTSDTFIFFKLATDQAELARNDFGSYLTFLFSSQEGYFLGEHRTVFYTKITSLLALLTGDNYWITAVYYSVVSFFASWYLANIISRLFPTYKIASCIAFLFFPSVVFWSSGIIKESLAMTGLFFLTAVFLQVWAKERVSILSMVFAVISALIVFNLKYYYLAVFVPVTSASLVARWVSNKQKINPSAQILIWLTILVFGFVAVTCLHPNFSPSKLLQVIVSSNRVFMEVCTPDDVIHFYNLEPAWSSILLNSPWALVSGFFRPFVWEANTVFKFITGVENLAVLSLFILAVRFVKDIYHSSNRILILAVILYCALLSIFLALSTPNFGTLARYGVGFLPFIVLLVFNQPFITKLFSRLF